MGVLTAQTTTGSSTAASTTTATWANNTTTGNTIVVAIANASLSAGQVSGVSDSQGNVYQQAFDRDNGSIGDLSLWYAAGIQGGVTPTVTVTYIGVTTANVICREYWGLYIPSQNPFDQQTSQQGNSNSLSSGSVTLTQPIELLVGVGLIPATGTFTVGAGYSNLAQQGSVGVPVALEDQYTTSGGSPSASFGSSLSGQWVCGIATFFQAPAGTTTSTTTGTTTSTSSTSTSMSSTSISSTSTSYSTSSTSSSLSSTSSSISSTSSSTSSTSISSTSSSTSISSTSTSISSTSTSSTSTSSTSSSTSFSTTSISFSSTSSSISSTSTSFSSTSASSTSSSTSQSTTTLPPPYISYSYEDVGAEKVLVNESMQSPPLTGSLVNNSGIEAWNPGGWLLLNNNINQYGDIEYFGILPPIFTASADMQMGTTSGADGSWFYYGFANTPTTEGDAGGYLINRNDFGNTIEIRFNGSVLNSVSYTKDTNFDTLQVSVVVNSAGLATFTITYLGIVVMTYTDPTPEVLPGTRYGWGARSGGTANIHNIRNLLLYVGNATPPLTNNPLTTPFTVPNYSNVSADDGDYFIQSGTQYVITQFKNTHQNNTDSITVTWKGRSTEAPFISPLVLQIYNQTTNLWETIATQTILSADIDLILQGSPSSGSANYYDSTNTVTARVYQQVV